MEALNFLKFWRPTMAAANPTETLEISHPFVETDDEDQEEDSFFDLELTGLDSVKSSGGSELGVSPAEVFSKRKIMPIEANLKPQSPISLLKSAPKFRVSMSKKSKLMETQKTGEAEFAGEHRNGNVYTVKFKFGDVTNLSSTLSRDQSKRQKPTIDDLLSEDSNSKRFPKDLMQKYLKLIKPLYVKVSKKSSDKLKFSGELSFPSPASSPAMPPVQYPSKREKQGNFPSGIRAVCKSLGKSKSASAVASRRDDSLLQQHDGIQSAILHCKRSFNSSRDSSMILKSITDPDENLIDSARNSSENGH